jgi:hypothetical protein
LTPEQQAIIGASDKEHQREMDDLGIRELRKPVDSDPSSPNATNYDESKADVYPKIPDALVMNDGKPVTSAGMWWKQRRPQIVELFDREILGRTPANLPKVNWEVVNTVHEKNGDVAIVTKKLVGRVDNSADPKITVNIELTLSTPADAKGPVPVIMELGFSKEVLAMIARRYPQLAAQSGPTWQQQCWREVGDMPSTSRPPSSRTTARG